MLGLPNESRIMLKIAGSKLTYKESALALIFDALQIIAYNQGHAKGAKRPESLYKKLTAEKKQKDELMQFDTPEQYEEWRKEHYE